MKIDFAREIALKALYEIDNEKAYSNIALDKYLNLNREKLNVKDINFISEIVYGVTSWRLTIDYVIQKYSKVKINKISKWILNILRIGVYQIIFLDKIPKSAAVNESVNLSKKYGFKSTGFVNAILRKIDKKDYEEIKNIDNIIDKFSKLYSMPVWIVDKLTKEYGNDETEKILKSYNARANITLRINTLKINKERFKEKLEENNISYEEGKLENFLYIKNVKNISNLDLFKDGFCIIQDEGAGKIAIVLDPKPGQTILDACSAPGGKTTQLAELMKNIGKIEAWDLYKHRINLVKENYQRMGITIIEEMTKDVLAFDKNKINKFDKILLDVPCLGIGVIKRKPDIKWQREEKDVENITNVQLKMLDICSNYLKIGGELTYSTCSIFKEENEEIIEKFLKSKNVDKYKNNIKFEKIYEEKIIPNEKNDGFYICKIAKKS